MPHNIKFALIGIEQNPYGCQLIDALAKSNMFPEYIICEDSSSESILKTLYYVENSITLDSVLSQQPLHFLYGSTLDSFKLTAIKKKIPCFSVKSHNSRLTKSILHQYHVDILVITQGPIIKQSILYSANLFLMNIHAAPLPEYRGNWATAIAMFNCEKLYVCSHVVTNEVDRGPIILKTEVPIPKTNSIESINTIANQKAIECAINSLSLIEQGKLNLTYQKTWQGNTWKGRRGDYFYPAMPLYNQYELKKRLNCNNEG